MGLYLYYDTQKGLVKQRNGAVGLYIQEHDEKGWMENIPLYAVETFVNRKNGI